MLRPRGVFNALTTTTTNPVAATLTLSTLSLFLLVSYSTSTTSASRPLRHTAHAPAAAALDNNNNNNWVANLSRHAASVYSEGGQDGIIAEIFRHVQPRTRTFVEIGFGYVSRDDNATIERALHGTNTYNLKSPQVASTTTLNNDPDTQTQETSSSPWTGIYFDAVFQHPAIGLFRETITPDNVIDTLHKHDVDEHVDYIHIDVDSVDLWLFEAIINNASPSSVTKATTTERRLFQPQVVSVEYNSNFNYDAKVTVDRHWQVWKQDIVYGASLAALIDVATRHGYEPVHVEGYLDVFFVRSEALQMSGGRGFTMEEMRSRFPLPIRLHGVREHSNVSRFVDYDTWRRTGDMNLARKDAVRHVNVVKRMHQSKGA